jgi:uroporphyrinogen-III decarboxylase
MTPRDRFLKTLNFLKPDDRLPMVEWAAWWDQTLDRWKTEGLPQEITWDQSLEQFGLDKLVCIHALGRGKTCPRPASHGAGIVTGTRSYAEIRPHLYADATIEEVLQQARDLKERHEQGEAIIRLWLDGFFWFPRTLFGIERHLYAFYDQPALMHKMNDELADFNIRLVKALFPILSPDMVGFAEDMSYNHGPMLSYALFKEFLTPYYQRVIPHIRKWGVKVLIDSDGDITSMIPWLAEAGIEGVYPLEKQAGVDIVGIRQSYPQFLMLGGYDKMVMSRGEAAMRAEFERILPVMRSGGYIPSVDHQTPPGVSLENYKVYVRLFREYAHKAVDQMT